MFFGIGPQHELIAALVSLALRGTASGRVQKPQAHGQIAADHVTHGSLQIQPTAVTASTCEHVLELCILDVVRRSDLPPGTLQGIADALHRLPRPSAV